MRILVDATTEVGQRTARILLGEAAVEFVGLWDTTGVRGRARSGPARTTAGFDVAITDRLDPTAELVAQCAVERIPLVVWSDAAEVPRGATSAPIIVGANLAQALAEVLVHHPVARPEASDAMTISWTEPGKPLVRGEAVAFPEPVGMKWAKKRAQGRFVAYSDDEWASAVVEVNGPAGASKEGHRIVGVADHAGHLEALALAATALLAADGAYPSEVCEASCTGEQLLNSLIHLELDFATWRSHT